MSARAAELELAFERLIGGADGVHAQLADWVGLNEGPLLDLGCGVGMTTVAYERVHPRTVGLDRDLEALTQARLRASDFGVDVAFVCAPGERLPFSDARFGCVVAGESLQYVDDRGAVLREVARVLAPGGQFLLSVPQRRAAYSVLHIDNWKWAAARLRRSNSSRPPARAVHMRRSELLRELRGAGLEVAEWRSSGTFRYPLAWTALCLSLGRLHGAAARRGWHRFGKGLRRLGSAAEDVLVTDSLRLRGTSGYNLLVRCVRS